MMPVQTVVSVTATVSAPTVKLAFAQTVPHTYVTSLNVSIPSTILSHFTDTFAPPFVALALIFILNGVELKSTDPRRVQ